MSSTRSSVYTLPSTHTRKLAGSGFKKSHRHTISDDFHMDPPESVEEIERMFNEVMATRDFGNLPEKARRQMENYAPDRKWMLIRQHKLAEFKKEKMKEEEMDTKKTSPSRMSTVSASGMIRRSRGSTQMKRHQSMVESSDPTFYVEQLIGNEITLQQLKELDICLSSEEITWTKKFLQQEGALCLCNVLNNLYKTYPLIPNEGEVDPEKRERDQKNLPVAKKLFTNISEEYDSILEKELRLFRCVKVIADLSVGIEYLKKSGIFIQSIFGGLFSCKPQVRKWATDIIIYFYHKTDYGKTIYKMMQEKLSINVHFRFLKTLYARAENLKDLDDRSNYILTNSDTVKRYEVWLWGVSRLYEGRGRMGSKVGAYAEFKYSGSVTDDFMVEYALSTLLLMNTLMQRSESLAERIHFRRLFMSSGMKDIFQNFKMLNNTDVDHSLTSMESAEQQDQAELRQMEEFKDNNIDFNDPVSLFEAMWRKSRNTETGQHLLSMMQTLFINQSGNMTQMDPESAERSFKLVDNFVNNITMASGDDNMDMNISLNKLLSSYHSEEVAKRAMAEAAEAKRRLEEVEAEKANALQQLNEGSKGVIQSMKREVAERDMLMRRLRQKVDERDKEVSELKRKRILDKHQQEMEMREMLLLLHSYQVQGHAPAPAADADKDSGTSSSSSTTASTSIATSSRRGGNRGTVPRLPIGGRSPTVAELENRLKTKVGQSKKEARRLGSASVEPSAKLRDLRLKMDLLEREARDLENMDFEEFEEKIPEPPAKTERQADLETLAGLRKKLDSLQMDANKVIKIQNNLSKEESIKKKKFEALDRLSKLQRYAEDLRIKELEAGSKGEVQSLDPKAQKTNIRSAKLRGELDSIEELCKNLKDKLTTDKTVSNVGIYGTSSQMGSTGTATGTAVGGEDEVTGKAAAGNEVEALSSEQQMKRAATGKADGQTAEQLLSKFEDRYTRGKKTQPKAEYVNSGAASGPISVKKIDKDGMRPFLGELQSKVAKMAAIDDKEDGGAGDEDTSNETLTRTSTRSSKGPMSHPPSSGLPLNPAQKKRSSTQPAKLERAASVQSDSHARHHHQHHHHSHNDGKSRTKVINTHHHYVDGGVSIESFDASMSSSQESINSLSKKISAGGYSAVGSDGHLSKSSTYTGNESIKSTGASAAAQVSRMNENSTASETIDRSGSKKLSQKVSGTDQPGSSRMLSASNSVENTDKTSAVNGSLKSGRTSRDASSNGRENVVSKNESLNGELISKSRSFQDGTAEQSNSLEKRKRADSRKNVIDEDVEESHLDGQADVRRESVNYDSRRTSALSTSSKKPSVTSMHSRKRSNASSMISEKDNMMSAEDYEDDMDDEGAEVASSVKVRRHRMRRKKNRSSIEVESSDFDTSEDVFSDAEESVSPRKKKSTGVSSSKNHSGTVKIVTNAPTAPALPSMLSPVVEQVEEMPRRKLKQVTEKRMIENQQEADIEDDEEHSENATVEEACTDKALVKDEVKSKSKTMAPLPPPPPPPPPPPLPAVLATKSTSPVPPAAPPPPPLPISLTSSAASSAASTPVPPPLPGPSASNTPTPISSPMMPIGPFDMLPRPKKKLKQLHWEKLEDTEDSFWANMGSEDIARRLLQSGVFDEIEVIFAAREAKKIAKRKKEEENKITFLKTDVSQQFGICLHSFYTLSDYDVVLKILHCDDDVLSKPALLEFIAKPELNEISVNLTKNFDPYSTDWQSGQAQKPEKDPAELARADRIYLELIYNLHHYWRSRMRALNAMINYQRDYDDLVHRLEQIDTALDGLEKSDTLRRVFDVILVVGNYMNDTSKQAMGFKLSSLQRLNFLKDDKNALSFLHYVEKIIHKNYPELEKFVQDLKPTIAASKISIEQIKKDCNIFVQTVKNIDSSLQNGNLSNPDKFHPEDKFLKVVLRKLPSARSKATLLDDRAKIILDRFDQTMRYFGEDPQGDEFTRNSFFSKFSDFLKSFEKAGKENRELEERSRLYELSMQKFNEQKQEEEKTEKEESKSGSSDMEKFLKQLRQTGPLRSEPTSAKIKEWAKKHSARKKQRESSPSVQSQSSEASDEEQAAEVPPVAKEEENIRNRTHDLLMKISQQAKEGGSKVSSPLSASTGDLSFHLGDFKLSDRMKKRLQQASRSSSMSSLDMDSLSRSGSYYTTKTRLQSGSTPALIEQNEDESVSDADDITTG